MAGRDLTRMTVALDLEGIPPPGTVGQEGPVIGLPRLPAPVFEGREAALAALGTSLAARGGAVVAQAVYGLGGVGKSELALQYAHDHRADYRLVWWVTAADAKQAEAGLAALARRLCPLVAVAGTTADAAEWAVGWLQAHDNWLLVLDNVEDPADAESLLARLGGGQVIVTSRRDADWGRLAEPIQLDVLDAEAATRLLARRTSQHADGDAKAQIAVELGFLPLALDQAAAYITQQRVTPAAYLESLRRHPARMHGAGGGDAQRTVGRLWDLHIGAIRARSRTAARLLGILARYAPDGIPRAMLGGTAAREDTDEALGLLASYSMIKLTPDTVSIHRLPQVVILSQPADTLGGDPASLLHEALDWMITVIPADPDTNMAGWPLLHALTPHAEALARHFLPPYQPASLAGMLNEIAAFLRSQGAYARALPLLEQALAITEATRGLRHPDMVALQLDNLASMHRELGHGHDALRLLKRAVAITEATLGPGHPDMATRLGNLAATLSDLRRIDEALPPAERALAITKATLGPRHPVTILRLGNLAVTYRDQGNTAKALALQEEAVAIAQATLEPGHPDKALHVGNLAVMYREIGRAAEARPLLEQALAITRAALGPRHPITAVWLGNLGVTCRDIGKGEEARPLLEEALDITNAALGPDHPRTGLWLSHLAGTLKDLGHHADAIALLKKSWTAAKPSPEPQHPTKKGASAG
jgi:tetratricopeptide (TPR) repeat protein